MVGFVGSIRSTQVNAMSPDVLKIGKPMMIGGTDPRLTHQGNRWLFRCRPNDSYSAKVIFAYGNDTLQKKKWAVVHSTDAFGTGGMKALTESLKAAGIEPVLVQGYTNQQADFTPVALAVRQSGADVLCTYFTFETDLGVFARQVRQLGVRIPWVGSPSIVNISALNLAGPSLYGTYRRGGLRGGCHPGRQGVRREVPGAAQVGAGQPVVLGLRRDQRPGARASTMPAAPTRRRSAPPSWRSGATRAPRASITSTPTATGCTATTSCRTRAARSSSTSASNSRL